MSFEKDNTTWSLNPTRACAIRCEKETENVSETARTEEMNLYLGKIPSKSC